MKEAHVETLSQEKKKLEELQEGRDAQIHELELKIKHNAQESELSKASATEQLREVP